MSGPELKDKIELKDKGEVANLPTIKQAVAKLKWTTPVDLDFMLFLEMKSGEPQSIFSDQLGGSLGNLNAFPFAQLSGDAGIDAQGGDNEEIIRLTKLDDTVAKYYFVALNFTDAKAKNADASFANYDGKISFMDETGTEFEIVLNSAEKGVAALIAVIDNTSPMGATIVNESKVMDLQTFIDTIPGAKAVIK